MSFSEKLPEAFLLRMREMLGGEQSGEYSDFIKSYDADRYAALRVDPMKISPEEFENRNLSAKENGKESFHLKKVPWEKNGFYYEPEEGDRPGRHPYHEAGVYYIQEPSAMAVAALAGIVPGERVLDLCAAPGGKSTQAAAALRGEGLLISNEINTARAGILSRNIERMGIPNAIVLNETPQKLADRFPAFFDRIIVDAPCSGEGMFRKEENAIPEWSPENVELCAQRQREILECASRMLADGGTLIYSTCTFAPRENEGTIAYFLAKHPEFSVEDLPKLLGEENMKKYGFTPGRPEWIEAAKEEEIPSDEEWRSALSGTIRLWPHRLSGEGHFAARLVKAGEKIRRKPSGKCKADASAVKLWDAFCRENLTKEGIRKLSSRDGAYIQFGSELYRMPIEMSLSGLHVMRAGIHLGTIKKERFEPGHALAKVLTNEDVKRSIVLEAEDPQTLSWLCGDALHVQAEKGWTLVTVDGFALGWGKAGGGRINNRYPKGLRIQM